MREGDLVGLLGFCDGDDVYSAGLREEERVGDFPGVFEGDNDRADGLTDGNNKGADVGLLVNNGDDSVSGVFEGGGLTDGRDVGGDVGILTKSGDGNITG